MLKYTVFYVLALAILGFIAIDLMLAGVSTNDVIHAVASNDRETELKLAAHQRFSSVLKSSIMGLIKREIRLTDACDQLYIVASVDAPMYLHMLPQTDPGRTLQES